MQIKRTIAILLAVCFLVSLTVTAVSAISQDYKDGCKAGNAAGYTAGLKNGNEEGYADGFADGSKMARDQNVTEVLSQISKKSEMSFNSEEYRKGYQACYPEGKDQGYEEGYKIGYNEGFKDGSESV